VTMVMLVLLAAILAMVLIVIPVLQKEIPLLQEKIPHFLNKLTDFIGPKLRQFGIKVRTDSVGLEKLLLQHFSTGSDGVWRTVLSSLKVGGIAVLGWVATVILIPVVLFYLLLDWHPLLRWLENVIPRRWVGQSVHLAKEVDQLLAQYLRGQLAVMLVLAVYYSVALTLNDFDVALPVGLITGLLVFIPYLGFGLGLILALIAGVLQYENMHGVIIVAIVYGIGQIIESFFLTPRLVGERIGLHPLMVIFALLAFGQLFGFVGILLALPASAIVSVGFKYLRAHYLSSSFYNHP